MSNKAAFLESEKGCFVIGDADIGEPGEKEVLIKVHACAVQPADAKIAKLGIIKMEYPTILGSPVAGTVEALGTCVKKVNIGARVVCGTKVLVHKKQKYGGLQRYSVVDESEVVEIGDTEFTKAVTLGSYTPPSCLFGDSALKMRCPTIPPSLLPSCEQRKKILIWGGSSAMGSLSISYAKQAGYTIISTSSPHNFGLLRSLGADHIFDHSDPTTVKKIRDLFPIDYWFDTISLPSTLSTIFDILAPKGEPAVKANVLVLLPPSMSGAPQPPEGVTLKMHRFSTHSPENADWNSWLLSKGGYLEQGIKKGLIKGVPPNVVGGLDKVEEGIERVNNGVSGQKIVIDPWA